MGENYRKQIRRLFSRPGWKAVRSRIGQHLKKGRWLQSTASGEQGESEGCALGSLSACTHLLSWWPLLRTLLRSLAFRVAQSRAIDGENQKAFAKHRHLLRAITVLRKIKNKQAHVSWQKFPLFYCFIFKSTWLASVFETARNSNRHHYHVRGWWGWNESEMWFLSPRELTCQWGWQQVMERWGQCHSWPQVPGIKTLRRRNN